MSSVFAYGQTRPDVVQLVYGTDANNEMQHRVWSEDTLEPASLIADANGELLFYFYYASPPDLSHLVLGAHGYERAGFRFAGGHITLTYNALLRGGSNLPVTLYKGAIAAEPHQASLHTLATASYPYYPDPYENGRCMVMLRISGLAAFSPVNIPQLWLGKALTLPPPAYGYDEDAQQWQGTSFQSDSGRTYETTRFSRRAFKPAWGLVDETTAQAFLAFKNSHLRHKLPFWFFNNTLINTAGYMMRSKGNVTLPRRFAGYRNLSLSLEEYL